MCPGVGWYLPLGLLAVVTSGCAGPGVSGDDYELVANPPGLESLTPTVVKKELDQAFLEHYQWITQPANMPSAVLEFIRLKDIYRGQMSYAQGESLPDLIDAYFSEFDTELGKEGTTSNVLGELSYQEFILQSVAACIFIEQGIDRFADQVEFVGVGVPLGDMVIRGWYCALITEPDREALFREFIARIGIKGYAVP